MVSGALCQAGTVPGNTVSSRDRELSVVSVVEISSFEPEPIDDLDTSPQSHGAHAVVAHGEGAHSRSMSTSSTSAEQEEEESLPMAADEKHVIALACFLVIVVIVTSILVWSRQWISRDNDVNRNIALGLCGTAVSVLLIFLTNFRGLELPVRRGDWEKRAHMSYYVRRPLNVGVIAPWAIVLFVFMTLAALSIALAIIDISLGVSDTTLSTVVPIFLHVILALVGLMYVAVLASWFRRRLPAEMTDIIFNDHDHSRDTFVVAMIAYFGVMAVLIFTDRTTWKYAGLSMMILPISLAVGRLEGKFFFLFLLQEYWKIRNWSIEDGTYVLAPSAVGTWKRIKGNGSRVLSILLLVSSVWGVISLPIDMLNFAYETNLLNSGSADAGADDTSSMNLSSSRWAAEIAVLMLSFGPLLSIALKPFSFLSVWLNQRLYEQMASSWDIKTTQRNMRRWQEVVRLPVPDDDREDFGIAIVFAGGGMFALLALTTVAKMMFDAHNGLDPDVFTIASQWNAMYNAIQCASVAYNIIFVVSIIFTLTNLVEERTMNFFARESLRVGCDLVDRSLFGMHWSFFKWIDERWIQDLSHHDSCDPNDIEGDVASASDDVVIEVSNSSDNDSQSAEFGLPYVLIVLNQHHSITDQRRRNILERILRERMLLPPSLGATAYSLLGQSLARQAANCDHESRRASLRRQATEIWAQGCRLYPDDEQLLIVMMIDALSNATDDGQKGAELFRRAKRCDRRSPKPYEEYCRWQLSLRSFANARDTALSGIRACGRFGRKSELYYLLAAAVRETDVDQSCRWLERSIESDPVNLEAYLALATLYRVEAHLLATMPGKTMELLTTAARIDSSCLKVWESLADSQVAADDDMQAQYTYRKCIALARADTSSTMTMLRLFVHLGECLYRLGQVDAALTEYEKGMQLLEDAVKGEQQDVIASDVFGSATERSTLDWLWMSASSMRSKAVSAEDVYVHAAQMLWAELRRREALSVIQRAPFLSSSERLLQLQQQYDEEHVDAATLESAACNGDVDAACTLARALAAEGELDDAVKWARCAAEHDDNLSLPYNILTPILLACDMLEDALHAALAAVSREPSDEFPRSYAHCDVADVHIRMGEYDNAAACVKHALALDNQYQRARSLMATIEDVQNNVVAAAKAAAQNDELERCMELLSDRLAVVSDDTDALLLTVQVLFSGGQFVEALPALETLSRLDPANSMYAGMTGEVYMRMQNYRAAHAAYSHGVSLDAADSRAVQNLQMIESTAAENCGVLLVGTDVAELKRMLETTPDDIDVRYSLAKRLSPDGGGDLDDIDEAISVATDGLVGNETCVPLLFLSGRLISFKRDISTAVSYYKRCVEQDPTIATAWVNMGDMYYFDEQYDKCFESLRHGLKHSPQHIAGWLKLGFTLLAQNRHAESAEAYEKALTLYPTWAESWYNLARCTVHIDSSDVARIMNQIRSACTHDAAFAARAMTDDEFTVLHNTQDWKQFVLELEDDTEA